jgi:DNA polymerase V
MFALVDCNNFFVSCERVFNPKLCGRPVIVLSNNDGCVVSRSNEAKSLGIAMGEPFFQIRDLVRKHNVVALSSNFALYGDLSTRVMSVIMQNFPEVQIYSIDEAFINLSTYLGNFDLHTLCVALNQKIEQSTGIPVSIGVAPSKTLAKVANHVAKKHNIPDRVVCLLEPNKTQAILAKFKVRDIWGIGRQLEKKLHLLGIHTAGDLLAMPQQVFNNAFNVVMQRTVLELQGVSCIQLRDNNANKQQIMVSRSFGHRLTELAEIQEALITYASTACEKLRAQNSVAGGLCVFLHTGLHGQPDTVYKNSHYVNLPSRSCDTRVIIHAAKEALQQLFRANYRYQKVGIILCDLKDAENMQMDLFEHTEIKRDEELMHLLDAINQRFGRATIQFAAAGLEKSWRGQSSIKSASFSTAWDEIPKVRS